ncbi:TRAP transporter 4TM/12TM fusion protein [Lipingzhangella halophila]|uniref:TRAP transporter 4TM/12TM fusion protein n=1 Tax=Lipingzhangella halophila TaxID=1783352 RepID=A0A7W7RIL5_9ACTN|nr:TRAP transporter fused permease subunit [Lipingzhangella halophila]MBB4932665.1 TRAP transporter 4TM/12TM fusion protein [Lipingzhangella halophila]
MTDRCNGFWRAVVVLFTVCGLLLTVSQVFFWNPFGGESLLRHQFLYFVLALFLPLVFLVFPAHKGAAARVPVYDMALFGITIGVNGYFGYNAEQIVNFGWDYAGPPESVVLSFVLWALVLEALRRCAGTAVTVIALLFSVYPLFAGEIPITFLQGIPFTLDGAARMHAMGVESILGLPLQTAGTILIGFLLFGVVLQHTGGATFFYQLAQAMFGHARGGSAKVAVVSSGSMGMMSGSAVSNVLTTGPMTIPAMKRAGFRGQYAAGVEATAASGGSITPPIMGTAAFLMVSFVGVTYREVALAAVIPAVLYYLGIFAQIDAYSAKAGLRGLARAELPRVGGVLLRGWPFLLALAGLVFLLVVYRNEQQTPFIVVAALLLIAAVRPKDRLTLRGLADLLFGAGRTIAEILGIIAGVGLIVGGLSMAGVSLSLARELTFLVGGSLALILIAGAVTSFVLGMGMTVSSVYVFLAIVMAPALVELGVNPMAAHLFVIYWATVSYITPPVALASFAAAGIAGTKPMQTSLTAMRLGMVKYIIPFCFAVNPALVAQAGLAEVGIAFALAVAGVVLMAWSFEGWIVGIHRRMHWAARVVGMAAGVAMLAPERTSGLVGLAVGVLVIVATWLFSAPEAGGSGPESEPEDSGSGETVTGANTPEGADPGGGVPAGGADTERAGPPA